MPCRGIEPESAACRSYALPTDLHPHRVDDSAHLCLNDGSALMTVSHDKSERCVMTGLSDWWPVMALVLSDGVQVTASLTDVSLPVRAMCSVRAVSLNDVVSTNEGAQ